jgi:hypothetical protein
MAPNMIDPASPFLFGDETMLEGGAQRMAIFMWILVVLAALVVVMVMFGS